MTGEDVKRARKARGLTQQEAADQLGISRVQLGLIERGQKPITDRTARQIAMLRPSPLDRKPSAHDPLEKIVEEALIEAGIRYELEAESTAGHRLDFHLPDFDIAIEVKAFHTPRIDKQLERHGQVILLQGKNAVEGFAALLRTGLFHPGQVPLGEGSI